MLKVGDLAPDQIVKLDDGSEINLRKPEQPLVIFFFPKAGSPVCTAEACAFRDATKEFAPASVMGVSSDSFEDLSKFRAKHHLGYPLASDRDRSLARAFGALLLNALPRRATFVIDTAGKVVAAYVNDLGHSGHIDAVKRALAPV